MEITERINLIIYLKSTKYERQLKKYGHIVHSDRKARWISMYVSADKAESVIHQLSKLKYVTDVQISPYKTLRRDYESV